MIGITAPNNNQWYHIKIEFEQTTEGYQNLAQNRWQGYINNVHYGDYSVYRNQDAIKMRAWTGMTATNVICFFDAIGYSWDSDYNIGNNLNEGLLLSFENSTNLDWMRYSLD